MARRINRRRDRKRLNRAVAHGMPVFLAAIVSIATWAFINLSVNYILQDRKHKAAFIVLVVIYFILLLLFVAPYVRTCLTINLRPGYVPLGPSRTILHGKDQAREKGNEAETYDRGDMEIGLGGNAASTAALRPEQPAPEDDVSMRDILRNSPTDTGNNTYSSGQPSSTPAHDASGRAEPTQGYPYDASRSSPSRPRPQTAPTNIAEWLEKDAFVCESDGLPRWCVHCNCWKPDRSHHCSEVGRCVWRMDHFCPWVGGIVAENSYKYFFQVVFWAMWYCLFLIVVFSFYINDRHSRGFGLKAVWVVGLGLACLFGFFTIGMVSTTSRQIYYNLSTVDQLSAHTKVYQIAIRDPNPPRKPSSSPSSPNYLPTPPNVRRVWLPLDAPPVEQKSFLIVQTKQGENPWRKDSALENFKEVMGYSLWEWWLPFGESPMTRKDLPEGWYRWNKRIMSRLRVEAGLDPLPEIQPTYQKMPDR